MKRVVRKYYKLTIEQRPQAATTLRAVYGRIHNDPEGSVKSDDIANPVLRTYYKRVYD